MKSCLLFTLAVAWSICASTSGSAGDTIAPPESLSGVLPQTEMVLSADSSSDSTGISGTLTIGTSSTLALIPYEMYNGLLDTLLKRGISIKKASIAAMGVLREDSSIIIITLDSTKTPHSQTHRLGADDFTLFNSLASRILKIPLSGKEKAGQTPSKPKLRQDGRVYFMIHSTAKASIMYPMNLARVFPRVDSRVITGVGLLSLGAALYGSYKFTQGKELTYGKVAMMNCFGEAGYGYPQLVGALMQAGFNSPASDAVAGWGSMIGFPLGIWAGSRINFGHSMNYGNAAVMRDFARWAYLYGFTIPVYFNLNSQSYLTLGSILTMCFIPAGFGAGYLLVKDQYISSGRSVILLVAQSMGTGTGLMIPMWFSDNFTPKSIVTGALVGNLGGAALGFLLWPRHEYLFGQGVFIGASAAVGAAVGIAVPLIAQADQFRSYSIAGTIGGWGGLALGEFLSRSLFERGARDNKTTMNVNFPFLYELPGIITFAVADHHAGKNDRIYKLDLAQIQF